MRNNDEIIDMLLSEKKEENDAEYEENDGL